MALYIPNIGEVIVPRAPDGSWDFTLPYEGRAVSVYVNLQSDELTQAKLEPVSAYFANTADFDALARAAIAREHSNASEDTVQSYIEYHLEELEAPELLLCFGTSDAKSVTASLFLSRLKLHHIGLYPQSTEQQAILDYTIGEGITDYVLAVGFDRNGRPVSLAMES